MFYAAIETDVGDILNILHPDGHIGGKAILSFLTGLAVYCPQTSDINILDWFSKIEAHAREPICQSTQFLSHSFYSGDWDYTEDEYEFFRSRSPLGPSTEDKFKETIRQVRQKWVDAKGLLISVNELIRLLMETDLEVTWWYEPGVTEKDFQALSQTLSLAAERGAQKVRIKFT